jgi:sugar lactone lactonase YvrE
MMRKAPELAWDVPCSVGECPTWDAETDRLWFCDIYGRRLYALHVPSGARRWWDLPDRVGSFALCRSGRLLVALRRRIVLFDPGTGQVTEFGDPIAQDERLRFNDGKLGPDGAFWVGTMMERAPRETVGALWRITPDGRAECRSEGYAVSNGLAWSPDGRTMFHSDSGAEQPRIDAWDFAPATGTASARRTIARLTLADGLPDGGACAADGSYISAGMMAGCLNRFTPDGRLIEKIALPVPTPTMPCFAGTTLWITSLRRGLPEAALDAHPAMGGLFRMEFGEPGVPIGRFDR